MWTKIIFLLGTIIIFSSPAEFSSETGKTVIQNKYTRLQAREERQLRTKKQHHSINENITVTDDDDEKKTLAQQVLDGKYGLIQTEIFSSPVKRPGILSYEVNPEVPRDNINNLGGLKPEEIWLAENHLLVIKGGGFSDMEQIGKVSWPPIDNYIAPQRQVKIPPNPKIPPPFPIQLKEGGPIEVIKDKNNSKSFPPVFNGSPFGPPLLFPLTPNAPSVGNEDKTKQSQGNFTEGNGGAPFPFLPPGLGLYPPAIAFLPPPGNLTELDEDDPRIYYPPPYDFVYKNNYTSFVPPGPLVPGIILPPPPNFFAPLENNSTSNRLTQINKQRNSAKKLSKPRINITNSPRHKISLQTNRYKTKGVQIANELKDTSPVHVPNGNKHYEHEPIPQPNITNNDWMPIPAPRPFYITDINKLKAIADNRGNDQSLKYVGPKNGWDYDNTNTTELPKILKNVYNRNNKNSGRGNKMNVPYFVPERNEENSNTSPLPQLYSTQINKSNFKTTVLPQYYTTARYESNTQHDNSQQYVTTPKIEHFKSDVIQQIEIDTLKVANPPRINAERQNYPKSKNSQSPRGKFLSPITTNPPAFLYDQYAYNKPYDENTFIPQRVYSDVTVKTPSLNGRIIIPNIKYEDDYRNTVKQTSKPLSFLYYEQESKYQQDDSGYSYNPPISNPYRQDRYNAFTPIEDDHKIGPISTTEKTPIYEYSYSAPGYGTVEAPKVGNSLGTTPKPIIYEGNFKSIKQPQYSYINYQPTQQNDYEPKPNRDQSSYSTPQPPINSNRYNTENPYSGYTTQDLGLLDEITKNYFTLFGQKINSDNSKEITPTPLPRAKDNYYEKPYFQNYENAAPVPTKAPNVNIQFPSLYNIQDDRPHFQNQEEYNRPKFRAQIRKQKPAKNQQTDNYSYFYAQTDDGYQDYKEYDQELVRPNHPLDSDIAVNYKTPNPAINPDAEFINPHHINPVYLSGNSYVSYKLPGNSGHFYFLTPQAIEQQNYPYQSPRIRYQDIKHGYVQRDVRGKILKGN